MLEFGLGLRPQACNSRDVLGPSFSGLLQSPTFTINHFYKDMTYTNVVVVQVLQTKLDSVAFLFR